MVVDTEYAEDARRIERDYVDPSSTTPEQVRADLEDADFANPGEIEEWVLTADDVAIDAHVDGVTTREEVEAQVNETDGVGYSDARRREVAGQVAREVGAPSSSDLQRAQIQAVSQETVTPSEVIEGDSRTSQISVVRSPDGDAVATIGGGGSSGEDVADELGTTHYSSVQDFNDRMSAQPSPDGRRALLYANGDPIGEVDLS